MSAPDIRLQTSVGTDGRQYVDLTLVSLCLLDLADYLEAHPEQDPSGVLRQLGVAVINVPNKRDEP